MTTSGSAPTRRKLIDEKLEEDEEEWMQQPHIMHYGAQGEFSQQADAAPVLNCEECPICQEKYPVLDLEQHVVACIEAAEAKVRQEQEDFDLLVATEMAEKEEFQEIERQPPVAPQQQQAPTTINTNTAGAYPFEQRPVKRVTAGEWLMQHLPPVFQAQNTTNPANAGLQADTDLKRKLKKFPASAIEDKCDLILSHLNASLT